MKIFLISLISLFMTFHTETIVPSNETEELENLLHWFLEGASDYDTHNRFWADDLIYTSSAGDRIGKNEILSGLQQDRQNDNGNDATYSGNQVQVRLYGDTAVVAFRLIAEIPDVSASQPVEKMFFYNTGTFIRQNGEWRAVAWQATRIPE